MRATTQNVVSSKYAALQKAQPPFVKKIQLRTCKSVAGDQNRPKNTEKIVHRNNTMMRRTILFGTLIALSGDECP